ncbi:MAG: tetratricopeptide repeat protein, partial [bacterium]|nr:tetratricopeptide repeat protein [bacterium]
ESMKPDFYVDDMREGKITAEVEAPSAAGSGGRITWALGSYTGPQSNTMEMLEFKKTLPDQILSLLQTSYEKSGLTFPEATGVTVEFAESEGFAFGDKMVAVDIQGEGQARLLILVEKALEEDSNSAVVLRGEMINLMIEWNKLLTKQPSWLRQIIRDVAKEQDRKSKVEEAVAAISIDEEIWGKNFENIIRGFDFIGKDEKFKTCDLVEVGMLQSFISLKGGYEAVRVVVDNLLEGKTYLQAFAIMAGEKRWQPFYSEFRDYAYRELLRMPDENSNVLFNVGRELLDKGDLEGARLKLQQSVKIDADNAEAQFLLGISYMRLRLFEQAQRYIQRALELDGGNPEYSRVFKELSDRLGGFEE